MDTSLCYHDGADSPPNGASLGSLKFESCARLVRINAGYAWLGGQFDNLRRFP
jgi:hypothetical protein